MNRALLEQVSEFKYLGYVLNESGTDDRKVASGRKVAGAIRSLVNARSLHLECCRVLHETLLVSVLTYGSEKERSRIRGEQMDNPKRSAGGQENR